ncbi:aldehyde dehydrogenase family protein [Brevundimonas sp. BAL450]|jgi:alpha-ketoglutaric semialdehyde dehydrogenase|uniref:2-ketoglutaric semialdehyde dehydrogenase n=1 Tax=Brevundimonas abyssalis TAR-001 TaxID=1391729 RepID=A0A8E0TRZ7_9CAUL|nr:MULTISPECIES: aldehyde dehydrogenase family protein [Brevundimonas]MBG7613983.1 aldehyde dehydrogenase family protein [Brevundimonas sp. BAL450]GAD60022.1 LOW QUALITY PROTEIN: 2-ketoglutaric semialdehyde dehydrogenase [Brevundimonas abyssalis TAR-001]
MSDTLELSHWINGEKVSTDRPSESLNPSDTRDVVARVPDGGDAEVNAAVDAARAAFGGWADASPEVRSDVLDKASNILMERREEVGRLLSREEGKTLAEGIGETARAARILKFFGGEALRLHGQNLMSTRPGVEVQTYRQAVGVYGLITPWNFPIAIPAWKMAPALAFGNTVVIKPAGQTPATAEALVAILHEAGLPRGVVNMIIGRGRVGQAIVDHTGVDAISFTGSQGVGAGVALGAVKRQARVQLEMGGKNPLVVMDDADLDRAVQIALDGSFFATGQRCTASSRLIVQDGIHDKFVAALAEKVKALRVGDALDPETQMGPAVSEDQMETSYRYIQVARGDGGRVVTGGDRMQLEKPGWYVQPTLIADTATDMRINQEEVFGPVASTIRVKSYEEALEVANGVEFGLSAGIVTTSLKHARDFQRNARAGMVMVNLPTAGVDYHVPFGGSKKSSYGPREQGFAAVEFFTQTKTAYSWS